jgi:hypothetical protein
MILAGQARPPAMDCTPIKLGHNRTRRQFLRISAGKIQAESICRKTAENTVAARPVSIRRKTHAAILVGADAERLRRSSDKSKARASERSSASVTLSRRMHKSRGIAFSNASGVPGVPSR